MSKRVRAVAAALAVVGTLAAVPGTAGASAPGHSGVGVQRAHGHASSTIRWHRCADPTLRANGLRCGRLRVPLDYRHPRGEQISLALTFRGHTSSRARYLGAMLVNPGGPGGSGRIFATMQDWVPHGVGGRFDWIGFDPRGVGASRPALHCDPSYFGYDRPGYVPVRAGILRHWRKATTRYAAACSRSSARRLLPHLTTSDSARDMDRIRRALGQPKISFYGFSYGSYLGQVYLTMFPRHARRVVLDGIVDPRRVWYGSNLDQDHAFDANMDVFWRWVAKAHRTYHLGTRWKQVRAGYYRQLRELAKRPSAGGRLGPDELSDVMLDAAYYVYGWREDAAAYARLVDKDRGDRLLGMYRRANVGAAAENGYAMYLGVECVDSRWPGWPKTLRDSRRIHRAAPFETWGNTWFNAPCIDWRAKARHRVRVHQRKGVPRFLLLSETRDAATPYSGALRVRAIFKRSRLIAGVGGTTHAASLSGIGCTDNRIAHYLATGRVPARAPGRRADVRCRPVPAPRAAGRLVAPDRTSATLRRALRAAQHWSLR